MSGSFRQRRRGVIALALLVAMLAGCVQRRFTIRSNPPGAQVYVDDYEIGTTPCSHSFIYYGTRKIRLVKDGYETLTIYQPMPTPWYQYPGIDFFSENIWPHEIRDERSFNYEMSPMVVVPGAQLLGRAEQLRSASNVVPATAVQPVVRPPIETVPPGAVPNLNTLPAPAALPPVNNLPPPPGFNPAPSGLNTAPQVLPAPNMGAPQLGAPPSYGPPGGSYWPQTAPPSGDMAPTIYPSSPGGGPAFGPPPIGPTSVPSTAPSYVPPSQPALPPGWRPIGMEPLDTVRR
jgi:hypothetical protein